MSSMQLNKNSQHFGGFTEGKKKFFPTYKRQPKSEGYINKKEQPPSWTDRVLFKNNGGGQIQIKDYDSIDNFMGSDHRPVYCDFEIPLSFPDFYQIIRGQFTQEALQYDLMGMIKINSLKIKNINTEFFNTEFSNKLEFPGYVRSKFLGDFISSESGISSMEMSGNTYSEFKEEIKFRNSDLPAFPCIPNVIDWIKKGRIIVKIVFKFRNFEFPGYGNVVLDKVEEKGLGIELNNNNAIARNTKIATVDLSLTYSDLKEQPKEEDEPLATENTENNTT